MKFNIDKSKAVNSLLFIVSELSKMKVPANIHKVMKILYFADQEHLVKYGRPITGDTYLKMEYGPVPSFVKNVADNKNLEFPGFVKRTANSLSAQVECDIEELSESDLECLHSSIYENYSGSFSKLTEKSHNYAWNASDWYIDYFDIAKEAGADEDILSYINERLVNDQVSFTCH